MKRAWALLVNPEAGKRGRGAEKAYQALRSRGLRPRLLEPRSIRETAAMAKAWSRKEACLAVYGGDGTLNVAGTALAGGRAWLAPLPGGTENALCRELGLSLDPAGAALALAGGLPRRWDLGFLGGRAFLVVAGVGLDAEVCFRAVGTWKRTLGRVGFALSAGAAFLRRPIQFSVRAGGKNFDRCWQAVFSNGRRYGGGIPFNPGAKPDDGLLDMALLRQGRSGGRIVQSLGLLASGGSWGADRLRIRNARLGAPLNLPAQVDGEPFEAQNPLVSIRAGVLRLLGPGFKEVRT